MIEKFGFRNLAFFLLPNKTEWALVSSPEALCLHSAAHSSFGSSLDQFSFKQKCNFFLLKIGSYGQIRALWYQILNKKIFAPLKPGLCLHLLSFSQAGVNSHHPVGEKKIPNGAHFVFKVTT